jgi:hypothetical protein
MIGSRYVGHDVISSGYAQRPLRRLAYPLLTGTDVDAQSAAVGARRGAPIGWPPWTSSITS